MKVYSVVSIVEGEVDQYQVTFNDTHEDGSGVGVTDAINAVVNKYSNPMASYVGEITSVTLVQSLPGVHCHFHGLVY